MAMEAPRGPRGRAFRPFHVRAGHAFDGFQLVERRGRLLLEACCECGDVLDVADASFVPCPECDRGGRGGCVRCGGTGEIVHHAALTWRLPDGHEEQDAA